MLPGKSYFLGKFLNPKFANFWVSKLGRRDPQIQIILAIGIISKTPNEIEKPVSLPNFSSANENPVFWSKNSFL